MRYIKRAATVCEYPCPTSTDCHPINVSLETGNYIFEVWGASGGTISENTSASGGYSYGEITIHSKTNIFIFLGGSGIITTENGHTQAAFNGGGRGSKDSRHQFDSSGGGASDIRVIDKSLNHRVIVAGGGGGSGHDMNDSIGGVGGGNTGKQGETGCSLETHNECGIGGKGGEQTGNPERFGIGEDHEGGYYNAAGGGGGWFGGLAGQSYAAGGGGGSGFVYTEQNDLVHVSLSYLLRNAFTKAGDTSFPSPFDDSEMHGRYGHGIARITSLLPKCSELNRVLNIFQNIHFFIVFLIVLK